MSHRPHVPRRDAERVCEVHVGRGEGKGGRTEEVLDEKSIRGEDKKKREWENVRGRGQNKKKERRGKGVPFCSSQACAVRCSYAQT